MATLQLLLNIPDHLTHVIWPKPSLDVKAVTVHHAATHVAMTAVAQIAVHAADQIVDHAAMIAADAIHAATTAVIAVMQ